jgi:hypothetical protein
MEQESVKRIRANEKQRPDEKTQGILMTID